MSNLPKPGNYKAQRSTPIVVSETEKGALMAWIECRLLNAGMEFTTVYGVCLGKTDGAMMERNFETLHSIFPAWASNNPFELATIPMPEGDAPEFILSDCYHDDSYIPEGKAEAVVQFKAKWINPLTASRLPVVTDEDAAAIQAKWSKKWNALGPVKPQPVGTPARRQVASKPVRTSSGQEVMELLVKKYFDGKASAEQQQELADKYYYPAQDELFGANVVAETPEQWGQVADKLGL